MTMSKDYPDHHDAELVLTLYDLRREPVMRASRKAMLNDFWPASWEDVVAISKLDHHLNAAYRQVSTYWEMAFNMARHGIVQPDYLAEHGGEGFWLYAKVLPWVGQIRQTSPRAFLNVQWLVEHSDTARSMFEGIKSRVEKMLADRQASR
jgi:hypothetical protein